MRYFIEDLVIKTNEYIDAWSFEEAVENFSAKRDHFGPYEARITIIDEKGESRDFFYVINPGDTGGGERVRLLSSWDYFWESAAIIEKNKRE